MVHFVGAGPGAPDLITLRGAALLREADVVIYAGSLVNPALLESCKAGCEIHNSAHMTLDELLSVTERAEAEGKTTVRLHTGDPSLYGAIREQTDALRERGIAFDVTPGVSSLFGAAAALNAEFTLPGVSQSLIVTRLAGRTGVPEGEALQALARQQCVRCTVGTLARAGAEAGIDKTALILVGRFLDAPYEKSRLYDPSFTTGFREGKT